MRIECVDDGVHQRVLKVGELANCSLLLLMACWTSSSFSSSLPLSTPFTYSFPKVRHLVIAMFQKSCDEKNLHSRP